MATSRNTAARHSKSKKSWAARLWSLVTLDWLRARNEPVTHPQPATNPRVQPRAQAAARPVAAPTSAPNAPSASKVYFSPGDDCLKAIIAQINTARKSLDICVFTISDDRISEAIIACHRSRVPVRIITDNEKLYDQGSDIDRFVQAGIPVRIDRTEAHMHHKFALIDGRSAVTGSYNWTRSAAIYNMENVLVTSEAGVIAAYAREFQQLWAALDAY